MGFTDLQAFMAALEQRGLLRRVTVEVSPELELTEIAVRVFRGGGPALLFERVAGSPFPVLINAFGTMERMQLALEADRLDDIGARLKAFLDPPPTHSLLDKVRALPRLAELAATAPRPVRRAPVQEVVETEPDLNALPILKCWPGDGGRFITLPLVITRHPETGEQNVGMYRMQVYDGRTTGLHWHMHKDGASHFRLYRQRGEMMEVAVALGGDPATIYAATSPLPAGISEFMLAGFLRRQPVEVVRGKTVDLLVPAQAEFVLEGYVDPAEQRTEGPFGDHTGYYSPADEYPVFHLRCLTRRRQPVYPATIVGPPPMEDFYLGKATERIFLSLIRMQLPEVVDINLPAVGVFHNLAVVSINKTYPGQARKVMHALWGMGQMMFTKVIVVVDGDVDVHDMDGVWWRVLNNMDPRRDVVIVDGPVDVLNHASPVVGYGGKMGIDGTVKGPEEGHGRLWPEEIRMAEPIRRLVDARWGEYGLDAAGDGGVCGTDPGRGKTRC